MVLCRCSLKEIRLAMRDVRLVEFHKDSWVDYTSKPCVLRAHLKVPSYHYLGWQVRSQIGHQISIEKFQPSKGCGKTHACNIFSVSTWEQNRPSHKLSKMYQNLIKMSTVFLASWFPVHDSLKTYELSMWTIRFPLKKWPVFWWFGGHFRKLLKYPHRSNPHLAPCFMDNSPYSSAEKPMIQWGVLILSHGSYPKSLPWFLTHTTSQSGSHDLWMKPIMSFW